MKNKHRMVPFSSLSKPRKTIENTGVYRHEKTTAAKEGTYTVTLKADNGTSDTTTLEVKDLFDIANCDITVPECTYNGKAQTPNPTVTRKDGANDLILANAQDYTVKYEDNKNCGEAKAAITGTGKYHGEKEVIFDILPRKTEQLNVEAHPGCMRLKWKEVAEADSYELTFDNVTKENDGTVSNEKVTKLLKTSELTKDESAGTLEYDIARDDKNLYRGATLFFTIKSVKTVSESKKESGEIWKINTPDISTLGKDFLYDVKNWKDLSDDWKEKIYYAHAEQVLYKSSVIFNEDGWRGDVWSDIRVVRELAYNYLYNDGRPVILKIMKKDGSGVHALLLLDYVAEQNGDVKIQVYDCNYPGSNKRVIEAHIDEENPKASTWTYEFGGIGGHYDSANGDAILTYEWEGTEGAFSDDELLTIINGSASSKQVDISQLPNAKRIIMTSGTEEEDDTGVVYWVDKKDSYDLNFVPAGAEITLATEYHSVTVKSSEECSLKLFSQDEGDSLIAVTSSGQNTVDVTFDNFSKDGNTINNITINGSRSDGGTITLKSNDSRVDIQGLEKLSINETQETEDENDDVTVNSDKELSADDLDSSKNYQFKDISAEEGADKGLTEDSDVLGICERVSIIEFCIGKYVV